MTRTPNYKIIFSTTLLIGVFVFLYFFTGVFGETRINLTLQTNPDLNDGLVAHYTLDGDLETQVSDLSGNANTGYLDIGGDATSTRVIPGRIGQGLYFDGTDDAVEAPDSSSFDSVESNNAVTLTAWVRYDYLASAGYVVATRGTYDGRYSIYLSSVSATDADLCYAGANAGLDRCPVSNNIEEGEWYHVAMTYDQTTARLYLDGTEIDNFAETNAMLSTAAVFCIGAEGSDCDISDWSGDIDDVRVYNRALSADEINRIYGLGATTKVNRTIDTNLDLKDGLIGHWSFDGDLETQISDLSENGNNAFLDTAGEATSTKISVGNIGQGLEMDGVDDYAYLATDNLTTLTVCSWIYPNSHNLGVIVAKGDTFTNWGLYVDSTYNSLYFAQNGVSDWGDWFTGSNTIRLNEWQHVCASYDRSADANDPTFYINGEVEPITDDTNPITICSCTTDNYITAGDLFNASFNFDGTMDDVRLYNRELSAEEVSRIYGLGATTKVNKSINVNPDLNRGLINHYTFDGATVVNEIADRGSIGTSIYLGEDAGLGMTTTTAPGAVGQGIYLDGEDISLIEADTTDNLSTLSACYWIKLDSLLNEDSDAQLNPLGKRWFYEIFNTGQIEFQVRTDSSWVIAASDTFITAGEWYHLCATYHGIGVGTGVDLYINGVEDESSSDAGSGSQLDDSSYPLRIGSADYNKYYGNVPGVMDDVRIYNRALSAEEVLRLYQLGQ